MELGTAGLPTAAAGYRSGKELPSSGGKGGKGGKGGLASSLSKTGKVSNRRGFKKSGDRTLTRPEFMECLILVAMRKYGQRGWRCVCACVCVCVCVCVCARPRAYLV